jgi:hypothetical protein
MIYDRRTAIPRMRASIRGVSPSTAPRRGSAGPQPRQTPTNAGLVRVSEPGPRPRRAKLPPRATQLYGSGRASEGLNEAVLRCCCSCSTNSRHSGSMSFAIARAMRAASSRRASGLSSLVLDNQNEFAGVTVVAMVSPYVKQMRVRCRLRTALALYRLHSVRSQLTRLYGNVRSGPAAHKPRFGGVFHLRSAIVRAAIVSGC